jgi:hypothetical protein
MPGGGAAMQGDHISAIGLVGAPRSREDAGPLSFPTAAAALGRGTGKCKGRMAIRPGFIWIVMGDSILFPAGLFIAPRSDDHVFEPHQSPRTGS